VTCTAYHVQRAYCVCDVLIVCISCGNVAHTCSL